MPEKERENERFPRILMSPLMKAFEVISYLKISKKKNEHNSEKTLKIQIKQLDSNAELQRPSGLWVSIGSEATTFSPLS